MLSDHLNTILTNYLGYEPTADQLKAIHSLSNFLTPSSDTGILIIDGHAGTGKTTLIKSLTYTLEKLKIKYELLAPTGRAAKVISNYCQRPAFTVHKKIYRQKDNSSGIGGFVLNYNTHKNAVFIIDESSMISNESFEFSNFGSGHLLDDIIEFIFGKTGCRVILVGDTAQLPPVGLSGSPALESGIMSQYGYKVEKVLLKQVVRQEQDSGILSNATVIRGGIESMDTDFQLKIINNPEVERVSGNELLEKINESYDHEGIAETIILCRSNKQANRYNQGIRNRILFRENEISQGDYVMVVKNSYSWLPEDSPANFIANGDIIKIIRIHKFEEMHGFRFCEATIELIDHAHLELRVKLLLDSINSEGPSISKNQANELYNSVLNDYSDLPTMAKKMEKLKADPYYNALQIKFAYAVTCHKAQGGQWKHVYIDAGFYGERKMDKEFLRWLYTAFTRTTEKLFLINFPDDLFNLNNR